MTLTIFIQGQKQQMTALITEYWYISLSIKVKKIFIRLANLTAKFMTA